MEKEHEVIVGVIGIQSCISYMSITAPEKNSLKRTYENYCSARLEKHTPKIGQSISKSLLIGIFVGHNCWCVSGQHFTQLNIYTIECNNSTKAHFSETKIQDFFVIFIIL